MPHDKRGGWNRGLKTGPKIKPVFTPERKLLRQAYWNELRRLLQVHLASAKRGEASRIARFLGVRSSQVHRWTCPICEHDAEPTFSIGFALHQYLLATQDNPFPKRNPLYYPFPSFD